jgi:hypothetical protein|tara:strand:+ start:573 stop:860 length:288 start_codon:yes stop_codon:yes gene_type:complete
MTRYHLINGTKVAFTAEEETARDAEEARFAAKEAATEYKENRVAGVGTTAGYESIANQLDQLYHDINAGKFGADAKTGEWFVGISSVKTAFPKPS